ncbi:UDP-glucose/GDP-mannose dehydrogenase family protein [Mumia sp. zg.B17]|uniref:UDP-glucose dehydrogenase family protein n=1 Tax=Mumia sp. zg.B17 TaxID=2855446 RepID=UPI0027E30A5D|nr:UDP-glucose/GDP-mannose dehydrogenase family protein [Mumia sp. zg.B17]
MKISVIGCGYLGAVHAACMASIGHDVVAIDVDEPKVAQLAAGEPPFHEPSFPKLLSDALASGRLTFTTKPAEAADATVHFICVGTPQRTGELAADLSHVQAAFASLLEVVKPGDTIVGKSTVPVGTAQRLASHLATVEPTASLVWNPEFLREGFAVADTLKPDRIVYGVDGQSPSAVATIDEVYAPALDAGVPRLVTDLATAELVKVAANAFLATKISFINAMADVCDVAGADVTALADAIGHDARIGRRFLNAGLGFGGGCLPKDIRAFRARAEELGATDSVGFLRDVDAINMRRRDRAVSSAAALLGGNLDGARIAVLGAAFKPDSDDVRDSPALDVAVRLQARGARVRVTDPAAVATARATQPDLQIVTTVDSAVQDADLVMLLTEWREYVALDPVRLAAQVRHPRVFDGRNALDPHVWRAAGWTYEALGRP